MSSLTVGQHQNHAKAAELLPFIESKIENFASKAVLQEWSSAHGFNCARYASNGVETPENSFGNVLQAPT